MKNIVYILIIAVLGFIYYRLVVKKTQSVESGKSGVNSNYGANDPNLRFDVKPSDVNELRNNIRLDHRPVYF